MDIKGTIKSGLGKVTGAARKASVASRRAMGAENRKALKAGKAQAKETLYGKLGFSMGGGGAGPDRKPGSAGPLGTFGGALGQAAQAVAAVPPPTGMQSGKKAPRITNPTISSISGQLTDILNAVVDLRNIAIDRINTQVSANMDAARVSKESVQESSYNPAEQQAQRVNSEGVDIAPLQKTFDNFGKALDDLIKLLEGKVGTGSEGTGLGDIAATGVGAGAVATAAAGVAAGAATAGIIAAIDQGAKAIQDDAKKQAEALKPLGMEPVYNEQGFTKGWKIQGKEYTNKQLDSDPKLVYYKNIRDAYGPGSNPKWGYTRNAREWLKQNPNPPDLKGGAGAAAGGGQAQPVAKPTTTAAAAPQSSQGEEIVVTASKKAMAAAKQADAVKTQGQAATQAPTGSTASGQAPQAAQAATSTGTASPGAPQATMEAGAPPTTMGTAAGEATPAVPVPGQSAAVVPSSEKQPPKPKSVGDIIAEKAREARQRMRVIDLTGQKPSRNRPLPSNKPTERAGYTGTGNVPDPAYYGAGNLTAQLYTVRM